MRIDPVFAFSILLVISLDAATSFSECNCFQMFHNSYEDSIFEARPYLFPYDKLENSTNREAILQSKNVLPLENGLLVYSACCFDDLRYSNLIEINRSINSIVCFHDADPTVQTICNYITSDNMPPPPSWNTSLNYSIVKAEFCASASKSSRTDFLIGYQYAEVPENKLICPFNPILTENDTIQIIAEKDNCLLASQLELLRNDTYYELLGSFNTVIVASDNKYTIIQFNNKSKLGYGQDSHIKRFVVYACLNDSDDFVSPVEGTRVSIFENVSSIEEIYAFIIKTRNLSDCYISQVIGSDIERLQLKIGNTTQIGSDDITEIVGSIYLLKGAPPPSVLIFSNGENYDYSWSETLYDSLNNRYVFSSTVRFTRNPWFYPFDDSNDTIHFQNTSLDFKNERIPPENTEDPFEYNGIWKTNTLEITKTRKLEGKLLVMAFNVGICIFLFIRLFRPELLKPAKMDTGLFAYLATLVIIMLGSMASYIKIESYIFLLSIISPCIIYIFVKSQHPTKKLTNKKQ